MYPSENFSSNRLTTSPELHTLIWMLNESAASMIIGISMGQEICLIIGQVSLVMYFSGMENDSSLWVQRDGGFVKLPDMDQKSFITSPASGNES